MSKRKNYGPYFLIASLVLGVLLLTGSFIWMADKSNMLLAVFVLILYGVGQWITVVYWQNIQNDWEATGVILGRLQAAVSDIPTALDSNLKAISQHLLDGQRVALASLQSEVTGTAQQTLQQGASLISSSLEKNLVAPLEAIQTSLNAWRNQADTQAQATLDFSNALRKSQSEWSQQTQGLVTGLTSDLNKLVVAQTAELKGLVTGQTSEFKSLAAVQATELKGLVVGQTTELKGLVSGQTTELNGLVTGHTDEIKSLSASFTAELSGLVSALTAEFTALASASSSAGEQLQQAWSDKAAELQSEWEDKMQKMQVGLVAAVTAESAKLGSTISEGTEAFLSRVEGLQSTQVEIQGEALEKVMAGIELQSQSDQKVTERISDLTELMSLGTKDFQELAQLAQVNQVEMQAGVGMLNVGLSTILERLEKQANAGDGYQNFMSDLSRALASFQKGASDVLIENAMKTQEILMEVLSQAERKNDSEAVASIS